MMFGNEENYIWKKKEAKKALFITESQRCLAGT